MHERVLLEGLKTQLGELCRFFFQKRFAVPCGRLQLQKGSFVISFRMRLILKVLSLLSFVLVNGFVPKGVKSA